MVHHDTNAHVRKLNAVLHSMQACQYLLAPQSSICSGSRAASNADSAQGNTSNADDQIPGPCDDGDIPDVHLKAGCNIRQGATSFCRASLGVRCMPHSLRAAAAHEEPGSCSEAQQLDAPDNQMLVTTSDGQVFAVSMTDAEAQSSHDKARCTPVELQQAKWVSSMSASRALQLGPVAVGDCILVA